MLAFIFSVLGHPAVLLLHALHWSVGEYAEGVLVETLKVVLPESGRAQMEVVLAGTPEWMVGPLPDGTPDVSSRRLSAESATSGQVIMQTVISLVVLIVLTYITAVIYKGRVTDKRAAWPGPSTALATNDWKYTTFQCFDNCEYCLYGWCLQGHKRILPLLSSPLSPPLSRVEAESDKRAGLCGSASTQIVYASRIPTSPIRSPAHES